MIDWMGLFASYRVVRLHHDEVVQGVLHPELDADAPPVRTMLEEWRGAHFVHDTPLGTEVTLVRRLVPPRRERWGLHLLLFLATLFTTTLSGALFAGADPFLFAADAEGWRAFLPAGIDHAQLVPGLWFSLPLLFVLLGHELGHYLLALRRGLDASPPYFIPAPFFVNLIGTFGAFIRLRSPLINRAVLLDVGAAGPIASFVLSFPLTAWGLSRSDAVATLPGAVTPYVARVGGDGIQVGGSLVFDAMAAAFAPAGEMLVLHPVALAGWLGFFVTALNLFPIFQLDGGHVAYALLGGRQRVLGIVFLGVLLFLGWEWWGWWIWAAIILALGRGSVAHPPVFDSGYPLTPLRRAAGWACMVILALTFTPVPFPL